MFFHNFKYTLKYLFRNRILLFWTYAFPVILGALFYLAFSDIEKKEAFDVIDVAVVSEEKGEAVRLPDQTGSSNRELLLDAFADFSDEDSRDRLFHTVYVSKEEAERLLQKGKITGYLLADEASPKVVVKENGINETIFQQAVSQILQTAKMAKTLTEAEIERQMEQSAGMGARPGAEQTEAQSGSPDMEHPAQMPDAQAVSERVLAGIREEKAAIRDVSGSNLSYTMIEYYTLIAMACLYCATIGMYAVNCILANMSRKGMRIGVSPVKKGRLVLGSLCASYVVQLLGLAILFMFTVFVLKVDYGPHMHLVILLALAGSFAGLSMGIAAGALLKTNENAKIGIIIAVTMLGCFLSGMMGITMKYVIDKNAPVLNKVNPAAMITDGLYSLYYYDTFHRYWFNVGSLLVFSAVMIGISFFALKRQRYESL